MTIFTHQITLLDLGDDIINAEHELFLLVLFIFVLAAIAVVGLMDRVISILVCVITVFVLFAFILSHHAVHSSDFMLTWKMIPLKRPLTLSCVFVFTVCTRTSL